jgi:channel protein (hemolysin III family)
MSRLLLGSTPEIYHLPGFHEPFSAISHLIGAAIFLVLGVLLLRRGRGDAGRMIYLGIYAISCVFLFSMSAVYHMMERGGTARRVMERLDHGAIFVLIAGTCTVLHGLFFRGWQRGVLLFLEWTAAITGITLKTIYFNDLAEWLGLSFYLSLGWFGGVSAILVARRLGFSLVRPLLWGGILYSFGSVLEYLGWFVVIPGVLHAHEIFHLFVLAGALVQWGFVWHIAAGEPPHALPKDEVVIDYFASQ